MSIVARKEDSDYSPTWKWERDEQLVGRHIEFRRAHTEHGETVVWELDTDEHGPVSVWLDPTNLLSRVQAELARRKAKTGEPRLVPGELVRLNPGTKRPSKRNPGQTVWPFPEVWFEHGLPDTSAEELLLTGPCGRRRRRAGRGRRRLGGGVRRWRCTVLTRETAQARDSPTRCDS